ncbi:Ribosomal RNA large subunit methyltransferase I [Caprobacter fermentans]|uniref:Ribosomal RNA large subunit methyltransferase I n=1 Tax=Caproicibacter fermentans TaxID=2576756 RepID=A0A6N8HW48_9FIRM|nr:class I SAM-dependent rRNA methyltransferase [Caproicibacter fermentans]MVB09787.1 Ribosomal RNA large subunit methyltransferase I [Caproicibacter fermentans]
MNQERSYPKLTVTQKAERGILSGHPWVYDTEITGGDPCGDGELADVVGRRGTYLGTGFFNSHSKIRVRLISRNANDRFDEAFYERRLRYAWEYRKAVLRKEDLDCCRIIFGEADFFPGLTVDRFENILVTQTLSRGIEQIKPMLFRLLHRILTEDGQKIDGIYERNDSGLRNLEGMEQGRGFFPLNGLPAPDSGTTVIRENGIEYAVDFANGQKTGFFLDQKYNRRAAAKISRGKRVLDCFTDTGSFALNAARAGAEQVHAVDISESAIAMARDNARRNGLSDRMSFEAVNVFDLLPSLAENGKGSYDFVILDPPAFTKSRKTVANASRGYREINYRAMKLLPRGGYLATCSCSHFMTDELFRDVIRRAAADAQVSLRQIEARQQAPDHPILWNVPETSYLKFYLFQVV